MMPNIPDDVFADCNETREYLYKIDQEDYQGKEPVQDRYLDAPFPEELTSPAVVVFTKKNGDTRIMRCVVKEEDLPTAEKGNLMHVWDLDLEQYRAFNLDKVQEWHSL